jgi:hypothetical protein
MASLIFAFILMGAGGSLCSSTAQSSAFLNIANGDMPDASALWNQPPAQLFAGPRCCPHCWRLQVYYPPTQAWHGVFIIAACLTLSASGLPAA